MKLSRFCFYNNNDKYGSYLKIVQKQKFGFFTTFILQIIKCGFSLLDISMLQKTLIKALFSAKQEISPKTEEIHI